MRITGTIAAGFLSAVLLLSGCSLIDNMPKPPKFMQNEAQSGKMSEAQPDQTSEAQIQQELNRTDTADSDSSMVCYGMLIHTERTVREAYDPAEGTERILTYAWDSVRAESQQNPMAAQRITEELAALEDVWYTGSGTTEDGNIYGYNTMLEAAEDNYAIVKDYGGELRECMATRYVTVLRSDDSICAFMVNTYVDLGGAHGGYSAEAICFDANTGLRIDLDDLSSQPEAFRTRLVGEMMRLANEDKDSYYSDHLDLTKPEEYSTAFAELLREGSWYPGVYGFCVFSDLYELGSYAAGITEFIIPYDCISDLIDVKWIPEAVDQNATVSIHALSEIPEGSIEIVDSVVIGEGGEASLLSFQGTARDISIWTGYFEDRFYADSELFYCGSLNNSALQLAMMIPGDLPNVLLRYRDGNGDHEYLITISGRDGSYVLIENPA